MDKQKELQMFAGFLDEIEKRGMEVACIVCTEPIKLSYKEDTDERDAFIEVVMPNAKVTVGLSNTLIIKVAEVLSKTRIPQAIGDPLIRSIQMSIAEAWSKGIDPETGETTVRAYKITDPFKPKDN